MKNHQLTKEYFVLDKLLFQEQNTTPRCHYTILDNIYSGDSHFKSVMASRGLAKTTLLATKLPLLTALMGTFNNRPSYYTLIISETATQSESIIADILSLYEESEYLQQDMHLVRAIASELEFRAAGRTYHILGKGSGSKLRGIKRNRRRPDIIITDDLTSEDVSGNPVRREKLKRWFWKSLVPSREPTGYTFINVFTPLHQGDVSLEIHNADFSDSIDVPLSTGVPPSYDEMVSAWPDRFPVSYIKESYEQYQENGRVGEFMQEHYLRLVSDDSAVFDTSRITYKALELSSSAMIYVATDLAVSQAVSADRSVAIVMAFDQGLWKLVDITSDRYNPTEFMDVLFRIQKKYRPIKVGLETVGYQQAFKHHLLQEMMQRDEFMSIHELKDNLHIAKSTRIYGLTSVINTGNLVINEQLLDNPSLQRLLEQIELATREGVLATHDDEIDCLASFTQMSPVETYQARTRDTTPAALPWQLQDEDDLYYTQ